MNDDRNTSPSGHGSPLGAIITTKDKERNRKSNLEKSLIGLTGGFSTTELNGVLQVSKDGQEHNKCDKEDEDYVDRLIREYNLKTLDDGTDEIWYYNGRKGVFGPGAEPIVKARIERDNKGNVKNHDIKEYIGHIQRRTYTRREDFDADISWIAAGNYMINLRTGETQRFSPNFMCTTQIPVHYLPSPIRDFFTWVESPVLGYNNMNSECPVIMKFLYEIMPSEDVEIVLDFLAYCLWREYKFNVWMLFNGAGQNGKSTLINLIEKFFGPENVSGESLDRLLKERFAPANLYRKMVNVDADLSPGALFGNTGKLKKLTGNDEYPAEFKYKSPFKLRNSAKLFFSCNRIPQTDDSTDAFLRRIIIINFTGQFLGAKEDINLIDKLTTTEELSGLFRVLVNRLPKVLKNGIRQTTSEVMEKTHDKYMRGADPTKYFVEKALINDSTSKVKKIDMYDSHVNFCRENGLPVESEQSFSRKMTQGFGYKTKQFRDVGERAWFYVGVRLTDWKQREIEEQSRLEEISEFSQATQEDMK